MLVSFLIRKTELIQAFLHLLILHEKVPQETGPVVLDHYDLRALVYCKIGLCHPSEVGGKGIVESGRTEQLFTILVKISQGFEGLNGGVRHR